MCCEATITKRAVAWVGSVQPECTVPLSTWSFRGFKPEFLLNGKRPLASRVLRQPPKCIHNLNNTQPWHSCLFLALKNWPPWLVPGSYSFPVTNYDLYRAAKERPGEATVLPHLGEGDDWKERRKRKSSVLFPLFPTSFLKSLPPCAPLKRTPNNDKQKLFETLMTAIKLGWNLYSRRIYFI